MLVVAGAHSIDSLLVEYFRNIMHVNLIDNMFMYVSIVFFLFFVIEIIVGLFEEIVSRL